MFLHIISCYEHYRRNNVRTAIVIIDNSVKKTIIFKTANKL